MATPWKHPDTGIYWFRKRVPNRLRPFIHKTEIQRSLGTRDPERAKRIFIQVAAEIADRWEIYERLVERKAIVNAAPTPLTEKQRQGLAGEFYRWYVAQHDNNPGPASVWEAKLERERRYKEQGRRRPGSLSGIYVQEVQRFLQARDIVIPDNEIVDLARAAIEAGRLAKETLLLNANKNYSRRRSLEIEDSFPRWEEVEPTLPLAKEPLTIEDHFDECAKASGWSEETYAGYKSKLTKLVEHIGNHDLSVVTEAHIQSWKTALLAAGIGASTIKNGYLAAASSFFGWAVIEKKIGKNPVANVTIRVPKKQKVRSPALTDDEAALILSETLRAPDSRAGQEYIDARRWVPWLMAYSGARVNEITQLHGEDFYWRKIGEDDVLVMRLTPAGGRRIKTGMARDVPLHPHLIEQGFGQFLRRKGTGPLFFDPGRRRTESARRPQNHKVGQKLGEWAQEIGVDEQVAPNHGWRHSFNTVARIAGIHPETRDAIKGHAPRTEGERYGGEVPLDTKWMAIKMLPRYDVKPPASARPVTAKTKEKSQQRMATAKRAKAGAQTGRK